MTELNRRKLIQQIGLTTLAATGVSKVWASESCQVSLNQTEGPFYPIFQQDDTDTDLTHVKGRNQMAKGEVILMNGQVLDSQCRPVKGALVEIWQACESGKYNHPSDPNPAKLDPNFQYWGRVVSGKNGAFSFKTIKPGAYPATSTWMRPPHIHVKVNLRGFHELTTQVYFDDEEALNKRDRILMSLPRSERENVTLKLKGRSGEIRSGSVTFTLSEI